MARLMIPFIFIGLIMGIFFIRDSKLKNEKKEMFDEFPLVGLNDKLKGTLTDIVIRESSRINNDPNHSLVVIDGNIKRSLIVGLDTRWNSTLDHQLSIGDRIEKTSGENLLLITKILKGDTVRLTFQIADELGNLIEK